MKVKSESEVIQSCPTSSDPMDCSLPGSSAHGIFQARVLEWGAIAFSSKFLGETYKLTVLENNSLLITDIQLLIYKAKGEKERYTRLNTDLFKKIRDTKGTFHAKMGTMKDRNGMDLKKQKTLTGGKNIQKNYSKKIFMTQITTVV